MSSSPILKLFISIGLIVGGVIGGYLPTLWGAGPISYQSVFFSGVGSIIGVWVGYKLGEDF